MDAFISIFSHLTKYLIALAIVMLIFFGICLLIVKKFSKSEKIYKIYGLFNESSNVQILSLTLVLIKFLFLITTLFFIDNNYMTLIFILIPTIIYNLLNFRLFNILIDIGNDFIIYFIVIAKDVFINYYFDIYSTWYVALLGIVTLIFIFVYISYSFFREIHFIIRKNKYIRKIEKKAV